MNVNRKLSDCGILFLLCFLVSTLHRTEDLSYRNTIERLSTCNWLAYVLYCTYVNRRPFIYRPMTISNGNNFNENHDNNNTFSHFLMHLTPLALIFSSCLRNSSTKKNRAYKRFHSKCVRTRTHTTHSSHTNLSNTINVL